LPLSHRQGRRNGGLDERVSGHELIDLGGSIDIRRRILDDCVELGRRVDFGRRHDHRRSHDRRAVPAWIVRSGCGVAWG